MNPDTFWQVAEICLPYAIGTVSFVALASAYFRAKEDEA